MSVRAARFADIPRLAELYAEAHARSIYAEYPFDVVEAKQFFARSLQRHGHHNYGGSLVLVSEKAGKVEGFIVGYIDQVYPAIKAYHVTDLLFFMSERADPRDAKEMVRQVDAWGGDAPRPMRAFFGVTDAVVDWQRSAKFYQRLGYEQCGALFQRKYDRTKEACYVRCG